MAELKYIRKSAARTRAQSQGFIDVDIRANQLVSVTAGVGVGQVRLAFDTIYDRGPAPAKCRIAVGLCAPVPRHDGKADVDHIIGPVAGDRLIRESVAHASKEPALYTVGHHRMTEDPIRTLTYNSGLLISSPGKRAEGL